MVIVSHLFHVKIEISMALRFTFRRKDMAFTPSGQWFERLRLFNLQPGHEPVELLPRNGSISFATKTLALPAGYPCLRIFTNSSTSSTLPISCLGMAVYVSLPAGAGIV